MKAKRVRRALPEMMERVVLQLVDRPKPSLRWAIGDFVHFEVGGKIEGCVVEDIVPYHPSNGKTYYVVRAPSRPGLFYANPSDERYVLVVTGSRHGRLDTVTQLDAWVANHGKPVLVIIGDAQGVDRQVIQWCIEFGYKYVRVEINRALGSPRMFLDRNERMIETAITRARSPKGVRLIALPREKSKGTWHCYNAGRKAGVTCTMR